MRQSGKFDSSAIKRQYTQCINTVAYWLYQSSELNSSFLNSSLFCHIYV